MEKKIVVLKLNDKCQEYNMVKQYPKDMKDLTFKRIGSQFDKSKGENSKEIIRGLTQEEEIIYLPKIIGVPYTSEKFEERAKDYWADFTITPSIEGMRLNVAMKVDEEGKETKVPENIEDYMAYQFAMKSSRVAKTEDELQNNSFYHFVLEDESIMKQKQVDTHSINRKATIEYAKIANKLEENISKVDWILEMTKEKHSIYDESITSLEKDILLMKLSDTKPELFVRLVTDENLGDKAFLSKAISLGILTMEGNDYYYLNENIGTEEKGAISWLHKPEKSASVAAVKSKLEQARKDKRSINA